MVLTRYGTGSVTGSSLCWFSAELLRKGSGLPAQEKIWLYFTTSKLDDVGFLKPFGFSVSKFHHFKMREIGFAPFTAQGFCKNKNEIIHVKGCEYYINATSIFLGHIFCSNTQMQIGTYIY